MGIELEQAAIVRGTWQATERIGSNRDGVALFKTPIIKGIEGDEPSPNTYLVEQKPHDVVRTHFHRNSQFQVFVRGSGFLGRRAVTPLIVQYVAAHTGYGPITAGDQGLSYLTLRRTTIANGGAQFLPDLRDTLDRNLPKRQVTSEPVASQEAPNALHTLTMIGPEPSGLAAWLVRLPANHVAPPPRHLPGAGRFIVVTGGSMRCADSPYSTFDMLWTADAMLPLDIEAGAAGVELLVLHFPADAR